MASEKDQIMCTRTVVVADADGLHMRACSNVVRVLQAHEAAVNIRNGDRVADGSSIFELLLLAAGQGTELVILAQGPDAEQAVEALVEILSATSSSDGTQR